MGNFREHTWGIRTSLDNIPHPAFKSLHTHTEQCRSATFRDADADAGPQVADDAVKPLSPVRVGDSPADVPKLYEMRQCLVWSAGGHTRTVAQIAV